MLNKKIVRISFCFLICMAMVCSMCPIAFASTQYFQVDFSRPELSGNDLYIEVLMYNPSANRYRIKIIYYCSSLLMTYTDNAFNSDSLRVAVELNSDGVGFKGAEVYGQEYSVVITEMFEDGSFSYYNHIVSGTGALINAGGVSHGDYGGGYSAVAYRVYGDTYSITNNVSSNANTNFAIIYGETNSINQSIAQVINAIAVLAQNNTSILTKLDSIVISLNSIGEINSDILDEVIKLYSLAQTVVEKLDSLVEITDAIRGTVDSLYYLLSDIEMWMMEIYYLSASQLQELQTANQKLQAIIDILNSGQNQPTLKNPNESLDSAFGDVSDWFGGLDNFGNQLEANKAENQENLNNAKLFLSGVFGVFPPQIIIALVFVAIMILVAKVIGR